MAVVYYLALPDSGLIKIGFTTREVKRRVRDHTPVNESSLTVAIHPDGSPFTEPEALEHFGASLYRGYEWFALSYQLENHIWAIRAQYPPRDHWWGWGASYGHDEYGDDEVASILTRVRASLPYIPRGWKD